MANMDLDTVRRAYSRWSRVYDLAFGPGMRQARRRGISMLRLERSARVLEVGEAERVPPFGYWRALRVEEPA